MEEAGESVERLAYRATDQASFVAFVRALVADRRDAVAREAHAPSSPYGPDANGWENTSIEAFLGAALSWAEDTQVGRSHGLGGAPSWRTFALFLSAGKGYE